MCERFVGVLQIARTDAESLHRSVMEMLRKHDLQLENIRGQGYDGAAGQYTGLQSRLIAENNTALYVHCHAHVLNLILVDTCMFKECNCKRFFWNSSVSL